MAKNDVNVFGGNFLKKWQYDEDALTKGYPFVFEKNEKGEDIILYIAPPVVSNKEYHAMLAKEIADFFKANPDAKIDEETDERILRKVRATTILKGWDNWTGSDGNYVDYTPAIGEKLFETFPEIYAWVNRKSEMKAQMTVEARETKAKN